MAFKPLANINAWAPSSKVETYSFGGNGVSAYEDIYGLEDEIFTDGALGEPGPDSPSSDQYVYVPVNDILPTDDGLLGDPQDLIFGPDGTLGGTPSSPSSPSSPSPSTPSSGPYVWKYKRQTGV